MTAAALSDLRHMSAQTEIVEVWGAILAFAVFVDIVGNRGRLGDPDLAIPLATKYAILIALCVGSHERVGLIFRVASGDVLALAAGAVFLSPVLVLGYFALVKLFDILERPILRRFGTRSGYPFIPVVFSATLIMFIVGLVWTGQAASILTPGR